MRHLAKVPLHRLIAATVFLSGCAEPAFAGTESYVSQLGSLTATLSPNGQNASGLISWSASARFTAASPADVQTYLARGCTTQMVTSCGVLVLMYWVDGALVSQQLGVADSTITFDTTTLLNGPHEFVTTAWTDQPASQIIAVVQQSVNVNNGRTPMAVSSGWSEILLAPGQRQSLSPGLTYTNGEQVALASGVSYFTDSPGVATVSADGTLTAVSSGVAKLTTRAQGMTSATRVIVDSPYGFPHFARDGALLTQYDPQRSLFVRSVFGITPDEVSGDMSLAASAKSAGINAYTAGLYANPADSGVADLGAWRSAWDDWWNQNVNLARSQGVSLFLTGDDIAREPYELSNTIGNNWSASAIQHAFSAAQQSGVAVGVDMTDEAALLWGDTPTPSDGRWLGLNPPIPDNAFSLVMQIVHGSTSRIPVSWPAGGIASDLAIANWNGNPTFSDYTSHYWDGSAYYPDVPPGSVVEVSNPGVTWPANRLPAPGHYCFVATVGNSYAPAPNSGSFTSFNDFVNFVYAHNNITWRNFNVVVGPQHKWSRFDAFPFLVTGAWDAPYEFVLEAQADLPHGSRLALQVPQWIGQGLKPSPRDVEEFEDEETDPDHRRRLRIPIPHNARHTLGSIGLPKGTAAASHLLIEIPQEKHQQSHRVVIRQLYENREVGRITWLLMPKPKRE